MITFIEILGGKVVKWRYKEKRYEEKECKNRKIGPRKTR